MARFAKFLSSAVAVGMIMQVGVSPCHSQALITPADKLRQSRDAGPLAGGGSTTGSVTRLLSEAQRLTGLGQHDAAEKLYREAAALRPEDALPDLARFLARTGKLTTPEQRTAFARENAAPTSTTLLARTLFATGETTAALQTLEQARDITLGDAGALLLQANLLRALNRPDDRLNLLASAVLRGRSDGLRAEAFRALIANDRALPALPNETLANVIDAGLAVWDSNPRQVAQKLDPIVVGILSTRDYQTKRASLLAQCAAGGPGAAWLGVRILVRDEKFDEALKAVEPAEQKFRQHRLWPLLAMEKAGILSSLGRAPEMKPIYEAIAEHTQGKARLAALKESARAAMAGKKYDEAAALLAKVDPNQLSADERKLFWLSMIQVSASRGDLNGVIEAYTSATPELREDDRAPLHKALFDIILDTERHIAIEEEVRRRLAANPKLPPTLWRLAAEAAKQGRRGPNEIEALYQLCKALPNDYESMRALAETAAPVAETLAGIPKEALSVSPEEVEKVQAVAEKALEIAIHQQPLEPGNYAALIRYLKARKVADVGSRVRAVVADQSQVAMVKGVCAYALAINGYPADALPLYDEAIQLSPDNLMIQMNRASCLTRLDRWGEAADFYKKLLEKGDRGATYHMHEQIDRLWAISKRLKTQEETAKYFREVLDKMPRAWISEAAEGMGLMMQKEQRLADAEYFFRRQMNDSVEAVDRGRGTAQLGAVMLEQKKYDDAIQTFRIALDATTATDVRADLMQGLAQSYARANNTTEAVAILRRANAEMPTHEVSSKSLFFAGRLMEDTDAAAARQLYTEFLASSCMDATLRRQAQQRLDALAKPGKP